MTDIEMTIDSIRVSQMNNRHVIILKEKEGNRFLPMWTDQTGADAISTTLQNVDLGRPMTHDLLCAFADIAGLKISSAKICKLEIEEECFYAVLAIDFSGKRFEVDCRPSDAIAVAVRTQAPIFAAEEVLKRGGVFIDPETGKPIFAQKGGGARGDQPKVSEEELKRLAAFLKFIETWEEDNIDERSI